MYAFFGNATSLLHISSLQQSVVFGSLIYSQKSLPDCEENQYIQGKEE